MYNIYKASVSPGSVEQLVKLVEHVSEETNNIRDFNNCKKWPEFFTKESDFQAKGLSILCRKPVRA
jgi:hypothetical protein